MHVQLYSRLHYVITEKWGFLFAKDLGTKNTGRAERRAEDGGLGLF